MTGYPLTDIKTIVGTFKVRLFSDFAGLTTPNKLTGTITTVGTAITGTSTLFLTEIIVGDVIQAPTGQVRTIATITNNTTATLIATFSPDLTGSAFYHSTNKNTIVEVGEREESADIKIGVSQLGTMTLRIRDEYSTYTEGFWYKVLGSPCQLRFYLTEDGVDTFYFYGVPQEETVQWEEFYLGSSYIREVTLNLLSVGYSILDTTTASWMAEVVANSIDTGATITDSPRHKITALGLFSAMLSASGLNSSYLVGDTSFIYNTIDFRYTQGGNNYTLNDINIAVKNWDGVEADTLEYWDTLSGNPLSAKFATLRNLLKNLLVNFGVVLVMDYNTLTERHLIKLVQRGRAYSTMLSFGGREKKSSIGKSYDLLGDATRATHIITTGSFVWFSKKFLNGKSTSAVPNYVEFDGDYQSIFRINTVPLPEPPATRVASRQLYLVSGSTWTIVTGIDYFNYSFPGGGAYITAAAPYMEEAIAGYLYYRFTNKFTFIRRTYGTMRGNDGTTNSHTNISILRRTSINDGTGAANFYANKVVKIPETNEVEIEWIRETS